MISVGLLFVLIGIAFSQTTQWNPFSSMKPSWMSMNTRQLQSPLTIPFPQCVQTEQATILFQPNSIEQAFLQKLQQEDGKLKQERTRNNNLRNSKSIVS